VAHSIPALLKDTIEEKIQGHSMPHGRIKKLLISVLLLTSASSLATELSVLLPKQSIRLDYPLPARLENVLKETHEQAAQRSEQLEPLQAQLFDLNKQVIVDEQKQQILQRLNTLNLQQPESGAKHLIEQIESLNFRYREFTSLDYDVVQSQVTGNPLLKGQYQLNIGPRTTKVHFLGAIKQPEQLTHRAQWFLADYFAALGFVRLDSASTSVATIIQPDGKLMTSQYGNWNFEPHFLAPGATVYVPIKSLPSEFKALNQDVVQLLRHKVNNNDE
jgi:TolA-binding protein